MCDTTNWWLWIIHFYNQQAQSQKETRVSQKSEKLLTMSTVLVTFFVKIMTLSANLLQHELLVDMSLLKNPGICDETGRGIEVRCVYTEPNKG